MAHVSGGRGFVWGSKLSLHFNQVFTLSFNLVMSEFLLEKEKEK